MTTFKPGDVVQITGQEYYLKGRSLKGRFAVVLFGDCGNYTLVKVLLFPFCLPCHIYSSAIRKIQ